MNADFSRYAALRESSAVHRGGLARRSREVLELLEDVHQHAGSSLLDLGTADGSMLRYIQHALPDTNTLGLESDRELVKVAHERVLRVIRADARKLPFLDASFDVVTVISTLKHIPQSDLVLKEAFRVLKEGGHIVVSDPTPFGLRLGLLRGHFDPRYLAHRWSLEDLKHQVAAAGFTVLVGRRFMPMPVVVPGSDLVEQVLSRLNLTRLFMQQIVLAQR